MTYFIDKRRNFASILTSIPQLMSRWSLKMRRQRWRWRGFKWTYRMTSEIKKQWYVKFIMIQSKYYSVKTHFGSYTGTECHFSRIKYCFCWRWWIFIRHIFYCVDVIPRHSSKFSTDNSVLTHPYLLRIRDSGLIPLSVNLGLSNPLLSFPHLQRDATLMR